jgi:uncharacterized protein GlcG (DUF336 family)
LQFAISCFIDHLNKVSMKPAAAHLEGEVPVGGGLPLLIEGKIVGAIGQSGGSSTKDGIAANAGVDALK